MIVSTTQPEEAARFATTQPEEAARFESHADLRLICESSSQLSLPPHLQVPRLSFPAAVEIGTGA
jgi:hypothetical protein